MKTVRLSLRWPQRLRVAFQAAALVAAGAGLAPALAQSNPLADAPLFTASATAVKPNLMFILDDSGSMQWDFMPDAAEVLTRNHYGRQSAQCNGLAYDPDVKYPVPSYMDALNQLQSLGDAAITDWTTAKATIQLFDVMTVKSVSGTIGAGQDYTVRTNGTGLFFAEPSDTITVYKDDTNYFVAKIRDGGANTNDGDSVLSLRITYVVGSPGTTSLKLGKSEPVTGEYYKYNKSQPRLSWYKPDGAIDSSSTFYTECTKLTSSGSSDFTKVLVSGLDTAGKQNYANWAKYYRTRIVSMQSATSVAFSGIDNRYRIGYSTIGQPEANSASSNFLHIGEFTAAQKKAFYTQLFAAKPGSGGTPLRGALAKAGQYYANKAKNQDKDPIQFSCQRNFTILSTDGYWNTGGNNASESTAREYGPYAMDRKTAVGNRDNDLPRPMADGNELRTEVTERWAVITEGKWRATTGTAAVTGTKSTQTAIGVIREERRIVLTNGGQCGNNPKRYRKITTIEKRTITGRRTYAVVTEKATPTVRTVVTARKQETPYTRQIITDYTGKVTDTGDVPGTPVNTDTVESDATATGAMVTTVLPGTNTFQDTGATGWSNVSTTTDNVNCVVFTTGAQAATVHETFYPEPLGPATVTAIPNRTDTLTPTGDWIPTPTVTQTEKLVESEYDSRNGSENTLADVAAYYYETDLRSEALENCLNADKKDVCTDNVPSNANKDPYKSFGDSARTQHMTTFTLGMGVSGSLKYDPKYISLRSGDFHDIVNLAKNWPNTTSGQNTTVDDLWHAAVNGRGQYFSAGNPNALTSGLSAALAAIDTVLGSASAASTSSLQPVEGDNDIFVAQFTTKEWIGDVLAYKIDPNTGLIAKNSHWSAQARLEAAVHGDRKIYYNSPTDKALKAFTWTNLNGDGYGTYFDKFCDKPSVTGLGNPTQCVALVDKTAANTGANLVAYLRGDQTKSYYRLRTKRLGDVINASPLFVGKPAFKYTENGYAKFASDKATRKAVVLAAANDGMLHAFDRDSGDELWAYVPSFVLPKLYKLADEGFQNNHSYFVDGSPQMGDVYIDGAWKTIVVGGLNKGGRGYYALDVTNPASPALMWEYKHDNLGYTYGNPIITKRKDGTWVVVFASGYDNVSPGDGNGHLFVLNAKDGSEAVSPIPTLDFKTSAAVGTTAKPSGMARINSWVETEEVNTSQRFYAGDELGNVWRFDVDGLVEPNGKALQLATLKLADGTVQPITTKPVLAEVEYNANKYPAVFVATGSYMRSDDPTNKTIQAIYGFKDPLTNTSYGDIRKDGKLHVQTISAGVDAKKNPTRTSTNTPVDWATKDGWRVDLPVGGERVSVNPALALDTIYVGSNLPKDEDCSVGGDSFLYQFNLGTGASTANYVGNVLVQGLTIVQLTKGSSAGSIVTIITRSDGSLQTDVGAPPTVAGSLRRTSWRELVE